MKELILVTAGFPFGMGETFLETEIKYLAEGFTKVNIIAINPSNQTQRSLPENCHAAALQINIGGKEKLKALRYLFSGLFWKEIRVIRKVYKMRLTKGIINTMLISLYRAALIEKCLENSINSKDQVFYSYWCDDVALALCLLKEKHLNFKTISRIHRWDVYFEESAVNYLPYRHFISNQLNNIFSISEDGINYAESRWEVGRENFSLSRLGIESQSEIQLDVKPNKTFTIVSCSNLIPVKRVDLLAKAITQLEGKVNLRWIHIGGGDEQSKIEGIIKDVGETILIEMLGRLPNHEVFELYRKEEPDLFVNVSSSEGVPVSIMEAMSFGIPVLATDVGGNSEIVNDSSGVLVNKQVSIDELSKEIQDFVQKGKDEIIQLRKNALEAWRENYNAKTNYSNFVDQILSL